MEPLPNRPIPRRPGREPPKPKRLWLKVLIVLAVIGGLFDVFLLLLQWGLPSTKQVIDQKLPEATWIIADGKVVGELYQERRRVLAPGEITSVMRQAFVAAHDPTFYQRKGLTLGDLFAAYLRPGPRADGNPGGLSVPLAYTVLPRPKGKLDRVRIWLLARRLETDLSRDDLLTLYLDRVDLGEGGFGVEEAALHFFSKSASALEAGEAAVLASIAPRPSARSPRGYPELAQKRRDAVLDAMAQLGTVPAEDLKKAKAAPLTLDIFRAQPSGYLTAVRAMLRKQLGREKVATGGLTVELPINGDAQRRLQGALEAAALEAEERSGWRGPLTAMEAGLFDKVKAAALGKGPGLLDLSAALGLAASGNAEAMARATRVRPVEPGALATGRVTSVAAEGAVVNAGSVQVRLAAADAAWALNGPGAAKKLDQLLHAGDIVWVRVLSLGAPGSGAVRGRLAQRGAFEAAGLVADTRSGEVVALVGGVGAGRPGFDRARQLRRPTGAAAAPLVYGLALATPDFTAATLLARPPEVSPTLWDGDTQGEDDARSREQITAYEGFATHDVGAYAAAVRKAGRSEVGKLLTSVGLDGRLPWVERGPLGSPWALAYAWSALVNRGGTQPLLLIDRVSDRTTEQLWKEQTVPVDLVADKVTNLLHAWLAATGPDRLEVVPAHVGQDSWAAGLKGHFVAVIWVGPERRPVGSEPLLGTGPALSVFQSVMKEQQEFSRGSANIRTALIDPDAGLLSRGNDAMAMPFLPDTEPKTYATGPKPKHKSPPKHTKGRR